MAQQNVRLCRKAHNMDTINSEPYNAARFMTRRGTPTTQQNGKQQQNNKLRSASSIRTPTPQQMQPQISVKAKQMNRQVAVSPPQKPTTNIVHKDVFEDNENEALVEVTVKTSKPRQQRQRSNSVCEQREPWGKLLKTQPSLGDAANAARGTFNSFDPLRTLHFLAKELHHKLLNNTPEDGNLRQMLMDMQQALKRIPPEIASAIPLVESVKSRKPSDSSLYEAPERLRPSTSDKLLQTQHYEETEMLQKVMEESTKKLEASCRQMEMLCGRLKSDKEDLEKQLRIEKENVKFLKKRVGDLELQSDQLAKVTVKRLEDEKADLTKEITKLTDVIDNQSLHSNMEIKSLTHELNQLKTRSEQECGKVKHQLALATLEKERYIAILAVRDRQINEIRTEMTQLQDVVNEQLMEIHNSALSGGTSMNSIVTNDDWLNMDTSKESIKQNGDNSISTIKSNDSSLRIPEKQDPPEFKDIPSAGDSFLPPPNKKLESFTNINRVRSSQSSIRDMFAELKKQAFMISARPAGPLDQGLQDQ